MAEDPLPNLPRTREAIEAGIREGLHLGAQLHVSRHGEPVADVALGENRPGEPLTRDHLLLWLSYLSYKASGRIGAMWNTEGPQREAHERRVRRVLDGLYQDLGVAGTST